MFCDVSSLNMFFVIIWIFGVLGNRINVMSQSSANSIFLWLSLGDLLELLTNFLYEIRCDENVVSDQSSVFFRLLSLNLTFVLLVLRTSFVAFNITPAFKQFVQVRKPDYNGSSSNRQPIQPMEVGLCILTIGRLSSFPYKICVQLTCIEPSKANSFIWTLLFEIFVTLVGLIVAGTTLTSIEKMKDRYDRQLTLISKQRARIDHHRTWNSKQRARIDHERRLNCGQRALIDHRAWNSEPRARIDPERGWNCEQFDGTFYQQPLPYYYSLNSEELAAHIDRQRKLNDEQRAQCIDRERKLDSEQRALNLRECEIKCEQRTEIREKMAVTNKLTMIIIGLFIVSDILKIVDDIFKIVCNEIRYFFRF